MLKGVLFSFFRVMQLITLIPTMGMLADFVHGFVSQHALTPDYILILFITSVLANAWCLFTVLAYKKTRRNAAFCALVDLAFVATLIAAVYELRFVSDTDCTSATRDRQFNHDLSVLGFTGTISGNSWSFHVNRSCAMLKSSFAFGIMNIVFFVFTTLILASFHHREEDRRSKHHRRHSRRRSGEYSRSPRRSHHSNRGETYV